MSLSGKGSSQGGPSNNGSRSSRRGAAKDRDGLAASQGGTPTSPSTSTTNTSSIPPLLSLIVKIEPLSPDYGEGGQSPRRTGEGYFLPPNKTNGYKRGDGPAILLRWMGGSLSPCARDDPIRTATLTPYSTATVFSQREDTPHLLAVPFDARQHSVRNEVNGWRPLTFDHDRIPGTNRYYSSISSVGAEAGIAAPGSEHWMPQLLPDWYECHPETSPTRVQAGLIGNLPLLFALAAFSTQPTGPGLSVLLQSLQPGVWNPHTNLYPIGHIPRRGMVVTVYLDPTNPDHSTGQSLDKLQRGEYGPFYGPQRPPSRAPHSTVATGSSTGPATGPSKGYYVPGNKPQRSS